MDPVPFRCAKFSFCPDPCCGRTRLDSDEDCLRGESNICSNAGLRDATCFLDPKKNSNFGSIMINYFNLSCNCGVAGLKFSNEFGKCLDKDECQTGEFKCESTSQICVNTVGSFKCICGVGKKLNQFGECVTISKQNFHWYRPQYQSG